MIQFIVCLLAGIGAGLGTGFAGMSAAAVITPMLVTFLHIPAYEAVGIALASDILASAVSAFTYGRNKNLDIKNGSLMMSVILVFTVIGSMVASFVGNETMGTTATFMTLVLGLRFLIFPVTTTKEAMQSVSKKKRIIGSILAGVGIGFICGFVGAGGGIMMLLILTSILGYELRTAVGTSVFIMTFTALTGALSHFAVTGMPRLSTLAYCMIFTLLFARIGAVIANRTTHKTLNRLTGIILTVLGVAIMIFELVEKLG